MAEFERSRERKGKRERGSRDGPSRGRRDFRDRDSRDRGDSRDRSDRGSRDFRGRSSGRDFRGRGGGSRDRRPLEMTKVTCSACGVECEVPFKPTSDKPLFCSDCFEKQGGKSKSGRGSSINLDEVNEKLDKIMKALDIE